MQKRELKFRAWNGNKMIIQFDGIADIDTFNTCEKKDLLVCISGYHWSRANWGKDCLLLQFTGLKDKNEKEIYEADIIKCGKLQGVVLFGEIDGIIGWHVDLGNENYPIGSEINLLGHNKSIEVIGNIYENPDLIKK